MAIPSRRALAGRAEPILIGVGIVVGVSVAALILVDQAMLAAAIPLVLGAAWVLTRYPFAAILLWLLIFPFFTQGSSVMFWAFHRLLIPGTLALVVAGRLTGTLRRAPVHITAGEWAMAAFVLLALLNIASLSPDPADGLFRFYDRLIVPFAAYWLVRLLAPRWRDLRLLALTAFAAILGQVLVGSLGWVAPSVLPGIWTELAGARTVGSLGNVAVYSSTLVFCAVILVQVRSYVGRSIERSAYLVAIALAAIFVVLTFSRGSWLAAVVAVGALIALYPRQMLKIVVPVSAISMLLGATLLAGAVGLAVERLTDEATAEGRVVGNAASLRMIEERPLTGFGYETFNLYWERFKTRVEDVPVQEGGTSHNTYLTVMAELGVPALLLYAAPVLWWLLQTWQVRDRLPLVAPLGRQFVMLLWVAVLFHFTVSNFMDMIRFNWFGTTVFWLAVGLIASAVAPYAAIESRRRASQLAAAPV